MELFFLAVLVVTMAIALGSGYPVAFALPGAAIISIVAAAVTGYAFVGNPDAYFHSGGPSQWLTAGVTNETWSIELFGNNLSDERAELARNFVFDRQRVTYAPPRTYGLRATFHF